MITKKWGEIRSISAGHILLTLAAKVAIKPLVHALGDEVQPFQTGTAIKVVCEASAHAARIYLNEPVRTVILGIIIDNSSNCL